MMGDKSRIRKKLLRARTDGKIYPLGNPALDSTFNASVDRYSIIAERFKGKARMLDVGSGLGLFVKCMDLLGHECHAVDVVSTYKEESLDPFEGIPFHLCNTEIESLPLENDSFDAVCCSQVLEHFTHSHLPAMKEMRRVLRPGGILSVDVPNVACFRNRIRLLRGKNITWDYEEQYLDRDPILANGHSFFPHRHNREFTLTELELLFRRAGFDQKKINCMHIKSRRHREGFERLRNIGTALKDAFPSLRKTLLGFAEK